MTADTPAHHTAEHWAGRPRSLNPFVVKDVEDHGDSVTLKSDQGYCFNRAKSDLGREIRVGDPLQLETIGFSQITGLRDQHGWLFRLSNQQLADEARQFSEDLNRKDVERLEKNRGLYETWERNLPDWLQARIRNFHERGGEHFRLTGWGYELVICRLAALFAVDLESDAEALASELGVTGNQWDCAKLLAAARSQHGDSTAIAVPAGIAPITGSVDYS